MYKSNDGRGNNKFQTGKLASIGSNESALERRERLLAAQIEKRQREVDETKAMEAMVKWINGDGEIAYLR